MVPKYAKGQSVRYLLFITMLYFFSGCSTKTSEYIEDIFAENKVIKAEGQFKSTVGKDPRAPILTTGSDKNGAGQSSTRDLNKVHSYRGKIVSVRLDRDFNLYMYTFIDHVTHKPVVFYYNKNIQRKTYNGDYRIYVKGNYLIKYIELKENKSQSKQYSKESAKSKSGYRTPSHRKYKKRKRSSIKIPDEEKINTL